MEVLMRAMVYSAPLTLEMQDVPEPEPGPGEVVVEVAAAGICGSELEGVASRSPFRVPPLVMGHEFAGTVVGTGRRVVVNPLVNCRECDLCLAGATNVCRRRVTLGVHRPGGFAERVAVPERNLVDLPDDVGWAQAAMIEPLANAVHAVRLATAHVPLPRRLGVLGAGAIGLAVVVVAVDREIPEVHAVDVLEEKLATVRAAGATWTGTALDGEYDVVVDAVGAPVTRAAGLEHLRPAGAAVWVGLHSAEPGFDGLDLIRSEKTVLGSYAYDHRDFAAAVPLARAVRPEWLETVERERAVETFTALLAGTRPPAKTVLVPATPS
jgi:threonine dehydrogenase-like Zn-dependent dehydrogenase